MNRGALVQFALLALLATAAAAQNALEIIALRHRTAEQVIPLLQPHVEPGGTLSGQAGQLFVRTSPGNLAELRRALESIDRPLRRLAISVRFDDTLEASRRDIGASGEISRGNNGGDSRIDVRAQESRKRGEERVDQRIQTVEGGRATIYAGQSRPVRQRQYIHTPAGVVSQEVTVVQEQASGFEVIPRVAGNTVYVEIAHQRGGSTASGRLGEWFELGSVAMAGTREQRGIASSSTRSGAETRRVWIRVDDVP